MTPGTEFPHTIPDRVALPAPGGSAVVPPSTARLESGVALTSKDATPTSVTLTTVQKLRLWDKTRRAAIEDCAVAFSRLSARCQVNPVWEVIWREEYESAFEAERAANIWVKRCKIKQPGFMGGKFL